MTSLIKLAQNVFTEDKHLPFTIITSTKEQRIMNLPVPNPTIIFVLDGTKTIGRKNNIACPKGNFLFLSNSSNVDIRNIPDNENYFALLIEFDTNDFQQLHPSSTGSKDYLYGEITPTLEKTLKQFIEWSSFSPSEIWPLRKRELLHFLYHSGHKDINALLEPPGITQKLKKIISDNISDDLSATQLASIMNMSESTLRRKLKTEGTSIKTLKDQAKLGHGLYMIQTTMKPIGQIAEICGYHSQSLFTSKFKDLFGTTPTQLRKARTIH